MWRQPPSAVSGAKRRQASVERTLLSNRVPFPLRPLHFVRYRMVTEQRSYTMRDIDIRRVLRETMTLRHEGDPDTLIVEELGLCQGIVRVDMAVVNGSIHGYEIKSERDTLARLPGQTDVYNRALDFVTIVAAQSHADKIYKNKMIPRWWGVWTAAQDKDGLRLESIRESQQNPDVSPFALAQLLWREEALQALGDLNLAAGMRGKTRDKLWRRLAELEVGVLGKIVRQRLKQRGADWRPAPRPS
jgi:hypothetical protein